MPFRYLLPTALAGVLSLTFLVLGQGGKPAADRLPPDLALVPGGAVGFVSVRLGEVLADPSGKAILPLLGRGRAPLVEEMREERRIAPAEVERLTVVAMKAGQAPLFIVRARDAIDRKAVLKDWQRNYGKWDKERPKEVAEAREVRIGGRLYLVPGGVGLPLSPFADIIYPVDARTMVVGPWQTMAAFHAATGKGGPLADARALAAGTHHLVAAVRPRELLRQMAQRRRDIEDRDRNWDKPGRPKDFDKRFDKRGDKFRDKFDKGGFDDKDKGGFDKGFEEVKAIVAEVPDEEFLYRGAGIGLLPYKPLFRVSLATATIDLGKELKATARAEFDSAADAEDGQVAARSVLYVAREVLGQLPREFERDEGAAVLRKLVADLQTSLRAAKVTRAGKVVTAEARHALDAEVLKEVGKLARAIEDRERRSTALKQIGLAMHNFHDTYGRFPSPVIYTKDGKPGLSRRVALLPYLEEDKLFREFKLDEPWDSDHNKKLVALMPRLYASPSGVKAPVGHTFLRVFTGPNTPFPEPRVKRAGNAVGDLSFAGITDGTSNTLMVVEADESVPWTRPEELPYDGKGPLPRLGGTPGRFAALFCDGAVRDLRTTLPPATLRALITASGGEVVDKFE